MCVNDGLGRYRSPEKKALCEMAQSGSKALCEKGPLRKGPLPWPKEFPSGTSGGDIRRGTRLIPPMKRGAPFAGFSEPTKTNYRIPVCSLKWSVLAAPRPREDRLRDLMTLIAFARPETKASQLAREAPRGPKDPLVSPWAISSWRRALPNRTSTPLPKCKNAS